jgi:uncharacterized protein YbaR (Trm112 family)/SAM-dependent methyltransferase
MFVQYRLLDLLCCPECKGDLTVEPFQQGKREPLSVLKEKRCRERCGYVEGGLDHEPDCHACGMVEITEGLVSCNKCGKRYPIIKGVPRFLPDELQQEVMDRYPEFFVKYETKMSQYLTKAQQDRVGKLKAQTMSSFGYEWNEFAEYDAQNFLELIHPVQPNYFSNKLGLDCGCGAGRHTQQAVTYGAEMVAMDLSWAVDAAYKKNLPTARAMVVQCDVFNLPFKPERFQFIYSLGVLHHTTNPPKSFDSLVPLLKPGGGIMVWIYSSTRKFVLFVLKLVRMVTLRLPNIMIKWASFVAACLDYGLFIWPYKALCKVPVLGRAIEAIAFPRIKGYAKYDFHVSYTDWFDRLSYPCVNYYSGDQVREWYERNGLIDLKISQTGPFAWRGFGIKPVIK